jgi:hypothetical protein
MNNSIHYPDNHVAKPKAGIKRHQIHFVVATVACAAFVVGLVTFASHQTQIMGLCVLATVTLLTSLAAFFKAYDKD